MLYTGGGNIAECISFGRIAGERAAAGKSRVIA
jgi:succinate dehydrogenase/fumarate reductase flavoprotein subunit